jgi:hypothetical protein
VAPHVGGVGLARVDVAEHLEPARLLPLRGGERRAGDDEREHESEGDALHHESGTPAMGRG